MFAHKYQKFSNKIVNEVNGDVAPPNLPSLARPKHIINKQKLNRLVMNLPFRQQQSINGNTKLTRSADKLLLLSTIQRSLSSIHSLQSDIETNLKQLMMSKGPSKCVPTDEAMADSERDMDYTMKMQQQQSTSACQCCYHEESNHYDYDSHQLPGKLLNCIVLIAIVLHYLIIAFIEPNYFD